MTEKILSQYRRYIKELYMLDKSIADIERRMDNVPVVMGTVQSSNSEFPYQRTRVTVEMHLPSESETLKQKKAIRENRREFVKRHMLTIEQFIQNLDDSTDRQIFEMVFLEGKTHDETADELGFERSTISKRIKRELSHNSHF